MHTGTWDSPAHTGRAVGMETRSQMMLDQDIHPSSLARFNLSTGLVPGNAGSGSDLVLQRRTSMQCLKGLLQDLGTAPVLPLLLCTDTMSFCLFTLSLCEGQKQGFKPAYFLSCSSWSHWERFLLNLKPQQNASPALSPGRMQDRQSWLIPAAQN